MALRGGAGAGVGVATGWDGGGGVGVVALRGGAGAGVGVATGWDGGGGVGVVALRGGAGAGVGVAVGVAVGGGGADGLDQRAGRWGVLGAAEADAHRRDGAGDVVLRRALDRRLLVRGEQEGGAERHVPLMPDLDRPDARREAADRDATLAIGQHRRRALGLLPVGEHHLGALDGAPALVVDADFEARRAAPDLRAEGRAEENGDGEEPPVAGEGTNRSPPVHGRILTSFPWNTQSRLAGGTVAAAFFSASGSGVKSSPGIDEAVALEPVLAVVQVAVAAAQRQQLGVRAALDDLAPFEHQDLVGARGWSRAGGR